VEVHPLAGILVQDRQAVKNPARNLRIVHWLQLINQGYRITGVVNTDAHYNFHGSGGLRNWIHSPTDNPAHIKPLDIVAATRQGQVIMSNGPFLTVHAKDSRTSSRSAGVGPGEELKSQNVQLELTVQCPNWFSIDRVFVLVNGRPIPDYDFRKSEFPALFNKGKQAFRHQLSIPLKTDAHLIVVAAGENSQLGPVMGPVFGTHQPVAIANPIFIDTDGNGFTPNQDLLDLPLPVKGE